MSSFAIMKQARLNTQLWSIAQGSKQNITTSLPKNRIDSLALPTTHDLPVFLQPRDFYTSENPRFTTQDRAIHLEAFCQ